MKISKYIDNLPSLEGKSIIVTGANSGIGFALSKEIVSKGAYLVMACRNLTKAKTAKNEILKLYPSAQIDILEYDQASFSSIDHATNEIMDKYSNFDAIVFNAGILCPKKGSVTKEGFPLTVGTNYLGLMRFVNQLHSHQLDNKPRKFVFQGSLVSMNKLSKDTDLLAEEDSTFHQYTISKSCVECLYYYLSQNNQNPNYQYLLSEPGITHSELFKDMNPFVRTVFKGYLKVFAQSNEKAALPALTCLCKDTTNGDAYVPRALWTSFGFPKKFEYNVKRRYHQEFIDKGYECTK